MPNLRWDDLRVGDFVNMHPQGVFPIIYRKFDERSGLWFVGFFHTGWQRVWEIAYTGKHEEEVISRHKDTMTRQGLALRLFFLIMAALLACLTLALILGYYLDMTGIVISFVVNWGIGFALIEAINDLIRKYERELK